MGDHIQEPVPEALSAVSDACSIKDSTRKYHYSEFSRFTIDQITHGLDHLLKMVKVVILSQWKNRRKV